MLLITLISLEILPFKQDDKASYCFVAIIYERILTLNSSLYYAIDSWD